MAVVSPTAVPRRSAETSTRRADLRVVRDSPAAPSVGRLGTTVGAVLLAILMVLAGLHAVLVQTQARIDSIESEIATLEVRRNKALAELAWQDSPAGLAESAQIAGLVLATDVEMLSWVPDGELAPPTRPDPFAGMAG